MPKSKKVAQKNEPKKILNPAYKEGQDLTNAVFYSLFPLFSKIFHWEAFYHYTANIYGILKDDIGPVKTGTRVTIIVRNDNIDIHEMVEMQESENEEEEEYNYDEEQEKREKKEMAENEEEENEDETSENEEDEGLYEMGKVFYTTRVILQLPIFVEGKDKM
jgi:hypothetical protein